MTRNALAPRMPTGFVRLQQASPVTIAMRLTPSAPFDAVRAFYAGCVQAGWVEPSMIASGRLEQMLDAFEKLTLGPWARMV